MIGHERLIGALADRKPACDDCLARTAGYSTRQAARSAAMRLSGRGVAGREVDACSRCGRRKTVTVLRHSEQDGPTGVVQATQVEHGWPWEGAVQGLLVDWLRAHGHKIERVADTSARTPGIDIVATTHDGRALWITVKGYPQRSANVQARHWFAGAILDLVRYRDRSETALLGMGMPSGFMTYQHLAKSVSWLRRTLPFTIWWVSADGEVVSQ